MTECDYRNCSCLEVKKLDDLHLLRHLRRLFIIYFHMQGMMPWSSSFVALEELILERLSREVITIFVNLRLSLVSN